MDEEIKSQNYFQYEDNSDEINILDFFVILWRKKVLIIAATVIFACIVGIVMGPGILMQPASSVTKLKFKLTFDGVANSRYPNSIAFSPGDITDPLILENVYNSNQISAYNISLADFRDQISIYKADDGLRFLEAKYAELLKDQGLSPEGRQKIQDEYQTQRDKIFSHNQYYLQINDNIGMIPKEIQGEVLQDILQEWALYSDEKRGVFSYQIGMLSPDLFELDIEGEEYITQVDMLRRMAERIRGKLTEIAGLPGASFPKTDRGANLVALKIRLEDLIRYKISPLAGLIRQGNLYFDERLVTIYLQEQIYNLKLQQTEEKGGIALLKDSLDGYIENDDDIVGRANLKSSPFNGDRATTIIPQVGDQFLDRLVAMANENQDVAYRQDITKRIVARGEALLATEREITYYEELLPEKQRNRVTPADKERYLEIFSIKFENAIKSAKNITSEMAALYSKINEQTLQPTKAFYSTQGLPEYQRLATYSLKKILVVFVGVTGLFFCFMCFSVILVTSVRKQAV